MAKGQEPDSEFVRVWAAVVMNSPNKKHAILVIVRFGQIGRAGVLAVKSVVVEFKNELVNVEMAVIQVHALAKPRTVNSAIKKHVVETVICSPGILFSHGVIIMLSKLMLLLDLVPPSKTVPITVHPLMAVLVLLSPL